MAAESKAKAASAAQSGVSESAQWLMCVFCVLLICRRDADLHASLSFSPRQLKQCMRSRSTFLHCSKCRVYLVPDHDNYPDNACDVVRQHVPRRTRTCIIFLFHTVFCGAYHVSNVAKGMQGYQHVPFSALHSGIVPHRGFFSRQVDAAVKAAKEAAEKGQSSVVMEVSATCLAAEMWMYIDVSGRGA